MGELQKKIPDNASGPEKQKVKKMFDAIAWRYDLLNRLLSFGMDIHWRKRAVNMLAAETPVYILDIATGTGDFAIEAVNINPREVVGIDISGAMLDVARGKIKKRKLEHIIRLLEGDGENIPFPDGHFDAVIIGFGIRNFQHVEMGLSEMKRILKDNGTLLVLECSIPEQFPVGQLFRIYFRHIVPLVGRLLSQHRFAYKYLPASVQAFPQGKGFLELLNTCGFRKEVWIPLTFGIASLYLAKK